MGIVFKNKEEQDLYNKYKPLRGEGVYYLVENALKVYRNNEEVSYHDFSSLIRYDKKLRDNLYIYLALFEEYVRNLLFNQYEYNGKGKIKDDFRDFNTIEESSRYGLNFCLESNFSFGKLMAFIEMFGVKDDAAPEFNRETLTLIKSLRNDVMHHQLLLVPQKYVLSKCEIESRVVQLHDKLMKLRMLLPHEYRQGFSSSINKCNHSSNGKKMSKYIYLEVI